MHVDPAARFRLGTRVRVIDIIAPPSVRQRLLDVFLNRTGTVTGFCAFGRGLMIRADIDNVNSFSFWPEELEAID